MKKNSEMDHFWTLLRRRWLVILIVCIIGFAAMPIESIFIPAYKGEADLLIVSQALKDTTLSDPDLPNVITSTEVLTHVIKQLHLDMDPDKLSKKVKTKLPAKSSVIEVTYKDPDGVVAANVANAIADEAARYFHQVATRGYSDVLVALNRRIAQSRAAIADADRRLQSASANNAFASSDKALDDLTSQIDDLQVQRGQINASLSADQATAAALHKQLNDIAPIVRGEILQKDVVYQQVQTEVGKDTADLVSERASFRDSFPGLRALSNRLDSERDQADSVKAVAINNGAGESPSYTQTVLDSERADGLVASDRERLRATDGELADEQNHLRQVAGAGAVVGTLRAERDAALQQYISLTQRLSGAQGDAAQAASLGSLVVVSRAIPGPSLLWAWLLGIGVLVLMLAVGAAYAFGCARSTLLGQSRDRARLWPPSVY
jgi:capsular polysaccharide biosynthesis protein